MKSNALLFPCDVELLSMIEYIDFGDYTISGLVVLENSNAFATDDINIPIIDVTDVKYDAFDNVIVIEPDFYKHSFIENSIKKGKNVIYIGQKEKEDFDFKRLELISEEQQISVPIVFVVGTAPYTEKFQIQLALRKQLLANGYKVSSIGSKPYSSLFGFHSFPFFMNENKDDTQKIILFKKYVKCIEMTEQPDLIVIGIPEQLWQLIKKHHFDYGVTAYMVSQAVAGDYVIMNMLYGKKYTTEQLEELSKVCKYRLNFEVDSFHLSNAWLDPSTLKDDQLRIIKLGKKEYDQNVDRLYDLMNPTDMDRVYEDMITKLASYNVNQIFEVNMDKDIRVAIIDNGINEHLIKRRIEKNIAIDENGICIADTKNIDQQQFQHGTNCAMILEKYCPDCRLVSIRILDENGEGAIKNIYPALKWCYNNQICLVNLSLGTADFRDYEKLRCLINEYAAKGMIIVAATANSGFVSYPASLTNVIGVATTDSPLDYCKDYMQMGIDTVVPSVHTIRVHNVEISTSLSNSYAAPYISALIANKLKANRTFEIKSLKRYASEQSQLHMISGIYEPDWVYRAYVLGIGTASKAKHYFETVTGKYEEVQEEIDTIIAFSMADLENLEIGNKSLIYLGKNDVPKINVQGFFWSRETRQQQIINNHYQGNGLDVPVVILAMESTIDSYYILIELKKYFANDGYNAYTVSMEPECVLYGLEYMPEPASDQETWKKFIESQIFYKQGDLLIWCVPLEDRAKFLKIYPDCDVEICFCNEGENIVVKFSFEEEKAEKKFSGLFDSKAIEEIYRIIETKLTEDEYG